MIYKEPTIFLFKKLWCFAGKKRQTIVLFLAMSVIANCILLIGPPLFGMVINKVREIEFYGVSKMRCTPSVGH